MHRFWSSVVAGICLSACFFPSFSSAQFQPPTQQINEEDLRTWAERGDADAQFELGLRMITGEGVKKNEAEGVKFIEQAAKQKHLRAQFVLGSLYEEGAGVKKDEAKSVEWYRKAADNGFPPAQFSLGMAYDLGKGVTKDPVKASEWLLKAAEQNHAPSQTAYASKLERGVGANKSSAKAALWYLRAAQQDYVPAMTRLANLYYTGQGLPVDNERAGAWYQRAAQSEDPWTANNLAWFLGTCPDESLHNGEQAVQFAKRALKLIAESGEDQRYEILDTMAAALARNGEYLEAVLWQKKAITLMAEDKELPEEERKQLTTEFDGRLNLYQKQTPYSEPENKGEADTEPLPQDTILQDQGRTPAQPKKKKPAGKGTVV